MEYRRLGRFINLSLIAAFAIFFSIQAAAQTETGEDEQDAPENILYDWSSLSFIVI